MTIDRARYRPAGLVSVGLVLGVTLRVRAALAPPFGDQPPAEQGGEQER